MEGGLSAGRQVKESNRNKTLSSKRRSQQRRASGGRTPKRGVRDQSVCLLRFERLRRRSPSALCWMGPGKRDTPHKTIECRGKNTRSQRKILKPRSGRSDSKQSENCENSGDKKNSLELRMLDQKYPSPPALRQHQCSKLLENRGVNSLCTDLHLGEGS